MALVRARQLVVVQGYSYFKEREHLFARAKYVKRLIELLTEVEAICDETEVEKVIEEKIKEKMEESNGWGKNFEGWSSFRKYCRPAEIERYPAGKEFKLEIEYIRDWKMKDIIEKLYGKEFAILCKELGISAVEALNKK